MLMTKINKRSRGPTICYLAELFLADSPIIILNFGKPKATCYRNQYEAQYYHITQATIVRYIKNLPFLPDELRCTSTGRSGGVGYIAIGLYKTAWYNRR